MGSVAKKRISGIIALFAIFGFFALFVIIPRATERHLEGERVEGAELRAALAGNWRGYWRQLGLNSDFAVSLSLGQDGRISGRARNAGDACPGNGDYRVDGRVLDREVELTMTPAFIGCGVVHARYRMARDLSGRVQMKGGYIRMPNGNRGHHFLTRQ